eukprot:scaffold373364_cov19-Prasinocladus_malaysianus.AAC.1
MTEGETEAEMTMTETETEETVNLGSTRKRRQERYFEQRKSEEYKNSTQHVSITDSYGWHPQKSRRA